MLGSGTKCQWKTCLWSCHTTHHICLCATNNQFHCLPKHPTEAWTTQHNSSKNEASTTQNLDPHLHMKALLLLCTAQPQPRNAGLLESCKELQISPQGAKGTTRTREIETQNRKLNDIHARQTPLAQRSNTCWLCVQKGAMPRNEANNETLRPRPIYLLK